MGHDNFYKMKKLASTGPLSQNFFTPQKQKFAEGLPVSSSSGNDLKKGLEDIKQAIENKPVSNFNTPEVVDNILRFVETTHAKNKKKRNHYAITKSRI